MHRLKHNPLKIISIIAVFTLLITLSTFRIFSFDIWTHLSIGKYISQNHKIPEYNIFSYTNENYPTVYEEWLFQVCLYKIYSLFGIFGINMFRIIIPCFVFFILLCLVWEKLNPLTILIFLIGVIASSIRFFPRPELFSYLIFSIYLYILFKFEKKPQLLYLIPFLQVIWVNMHGYHIIGFLLIIIFLLCELFSNIINNKKLLNTNIVFLGTTLLLSLMLSFLNPYGFKGIILPFIRVFEYGGTHKILAYTIRELKSPLISIPRINYPILSYKVLLFIGLLSFLVNYKNTKLSFLITAISFAYLSIKAERNIAFFSISILPIAILNFDSFITRVRGNINNKFSFLCSSILESVSYVILLLCICIVIVDVISNNYYIRQNSPKRFGFGISEQMYPVNAVKFIKEKGIVVNNIFNNFDIGGHLLWNFYPDKKVFIDGRTNSYDINFYKNYRKMLINKKLLEETIKKYNIDCFLITHYNEEVTPLIRMLYKDRNWKLIYFDEISLIFLKNNSLHKNQIVKYHIDLKNMEEHLKMKLSSIIRKVNLSIGYYFKGRLFSKLGMHEDAIKLYQKALELEENPIYYIRMAFSYGVLGKVHASFKCYKEACRLDSGCKKMISELAYIYAQRRLNSAIVFKDMATNIEMKTRPDKRHIVPKISIDAVKYKLDFNLKVIIVDIRNQKDYKNGHIPEAINIPYEKFSELNVKLPKNKEIYIYGNNEKDKRSSKICKKLIAEGYNLVREIKGGFEAWKKAGLKVEK